MAAMNAKDTKDAKGARLVFSEIADYIPVSFWDAPGVYRDARDSEVIEDARRWQVVILIRVHLHVGFIGRHVSHFRRHILGDNIE